MISQFLNIYAHFLFVRGKGIPRLKMRYGVLHTMDYLNQKINSTFPQTLILAFLNSMILLTSFLCIIRTVTYRSPLMNIFIEVK